MACRMCPEIMFYERTAFRFVCQHVYLEDKITLILSLYEYINWTVEIRKVLDFLSNMISKMMYYLIIIILDNVIDISTMIFFFKNVVRNHY